MPKQYGKKKRNTVAKVAKRGAIYGAAGAQLWKDVKMLKNMINTEFKFFDTTTNTTVTSTPAVIDINATTVGDGPQNHEGMQYRMKSIHSSIYLKVGSTPTPSVVRMWWILDIDCIGGTPAFSDIFTQPIAGSPQVVLRNLGNKNRFLILKDMTCILSPAGDNQICQEQYYRKIDAKVSYDAGGTLQRHNRLLFVYASDQAGAAAPIIQVLNRIRFIDN